ncbi:beta-mannosidase [Sphingobacteriaceae bacterium]|nr:beta-mannosidase [Sphingobacteriaceae bacterium]
MSSWKFKKSGDKLWHQATVPGNVVADLFKNNLIDDPFYSDNEKKLQWIENENWEYTTGLICDKTLLTNKHIELIFEGLDTYARVYLNDSLLFSADNMFRAWKVDVKKLLKIGGNNIKVVFESAVKKGKEKAAKLAYSLPEGERIFTRKAQFQYGWDFGPRFATCGIWKPVRLVYWNEVKIESLRYLIKSINDSIAYLDFILETNSSVTDSFQFSLGQQKRNDIKVPAAKKKKRIALHPGYNSDTLSIQIKNPKRWWSNGLGEPYLYYYSATVLKKQTEIDHSSLSVGLRTIELINQEDSVGKSFYFKLNGKPVFMKGANYIPSDIFLRPKSKEYFFAEIAVCKEAHMNMLRVWGGGVYGDDEFYNACDEHGILVWQDLMFACAMYPGDKDFLDNVKEEVIQQTKRLRNHPSLALWCGNNENSEGWFNWGWQKQFNYSSKDSLEIWNNYKKLFQELIPTTIKTYDQKPYWESSPAIGWGRKESLSSGDLHYWGVWWGMQPFSVYKTKVGRFVSEYGFQSLPALSTFKAFAPSQDWNLTSIPVRGHQKHKTGFETIEAYMARDYKIPKDFKDYIYVSQLLQRDGMKIAIEAHRRNKPYCMGTLFWQLNDCWPGVTWSAIDYFKQPKALYYSLSNLYKTQLVSVNENLNSFEIKCVSDSLKDFESQLRLKILNFKSEVLWEREFKVTMTHTKVTSLVLGKKELPLFDSTTSYLKIELGSKKILASDYYFFVTPKNLKLPQTSINIKKIDSKTIEVSSGFFAKDVYLFDENFEVTLSENFFDLEAGQKKRITFKSTDKKQELKLKVTVLNNL